MIIAGIGAVAFGLVIGWITYRTLRRKQGTTLSDIATVIGTIGGAAVITLFQSGDLFGLYCIGLAVGFFAYLVTAFMIGGKAEVNGWMGD